MGLQLKLSLSLWVNADRFCVKTLTHHADWVRCLAVNGSGTLLASSGNDQVCSSGMYLSFFLSLLLSLAVFLVFSCAFAPLSLCLTFSIRYLFRPLLSLPTFTRRFEMLFSFRNIFSSLLLSLPSAANPFSLLVYEGNISHRSSHWSGGALSPGARARSPFACILSRHHR